ncbi:unnamed protein product [Gordionus sp. m RMFG-2023]
MPANIAYSVISICLSGLQLLSQLNLVIYLEITSQPNVIKLFKCITYFILVFLHLHNILLFNPKTSDKVISNKHYYDIKQESYIRKPFNNIFEKNLSTISFLKEDETFISYTDKFASERKRNLIFSFYVRPLVKRSRNFMLMLWLREIILNIIPTLCLIFIMVIISCHAMNRIYRRNSICNNRQYFNPLALIKVQESDGLCIFKNTFIFLTLSICYLIENWTRLYLRFCYFGDLKLISQKMILDNFYYIGYLMRLIEEIYVNVLWILITYFEVQRNHKKHEYPYWFDN